MTIRTAPFASVGSVSALLRLLALLLPLIPAVALGDDPMIAFAAERLITTGGVTYRSRIWTDGVRRRTESEDGKSGSYTDSKKNRFWSWTEATGCKEESLEDDPPVRIEEVGRETVDGHPTLKYKVTPVQERMLASYEWRATDLGGLVIQRKSVDATFEMRIRNIVLGQPDRKRLAFPAQCEHAPPPAVPDRAQDPADRARRPQAAGGLRTIGFSDAGCGRLVPLPIVMSIPSDYAIRSGGNRGCFWGAEEDLDRALASADEVDFSAIHRGLYWCRPSMDTVYDPFQKKFVSEQGPQERWPESLKALGVGDLTMSAKTVGVIETLRVSGVFGGQRVSMLYIGFGDSPAVLISYQPPGKGSPADSAEWQRFLDSVQATK